MNAKSPLPYQDIRDEVAKLCADFPGTYWRALEQERAYPEDFVAALTDAGYLAALIPEAYGGAATFGCGGNP